MMRHILFLFFLLFAPAVFAGSGQAGDYTIRGHVFTVGYRITPGEESNLEEYIVSRMENGKKKVLLKHTSFTAGYGGCGDTHEIELGDYLVTDSSFIFYSYWAHAGLSMLGSCGVRKQEYVVDTAGRLIPGVRIMNVEVGGMSPENSAYYEWVSAVPDTCGEACWEAQDKILKKKLNQLIEKNYAAHFVYDKKAAALYDEVTAYMKPSIVSITGKWDEEWKDRAGNMCR